MTCEMFDLARALMVVNIRAHHPAIADAAFRVKLFERMYGSDFTSDERTRIIVRLCERRESLKAS